MFKKTNPHAISDEFTKALSTLITHRTDPRLNRLCAICRTNDSLKKSLACEHCINRNTNHHWVITNWGLVYNCPEPSSEKTTADILSEAAHDIMEDYVFPTNWGYVEFRLYITDTQLNYIDGDWSSDLQFDRMLPIAVLRKKNNWSSKDNTLIPRWRTIPSKDRDPWEDYPEWQGARRRAYRNARERARKQAQKAKSKS